MDDNLLPLATDDALAWTRALGAALRARDVAQIAFSMQLRADVCTRDVVGAPGRPGPGTRLCRHRRLLGPAARRPRAQRARRRRSRGAGEPRRGRRVHGLQRAHHGANVRVRRGAGRDRGAGARAACACPPAAHRRTRGQRVLRARPPPRAPRGRHAVPGLSLRRSRTALLAEALLGFPTRLEEYSVPVALYDLGYNLGIARRLLPASDIREPIDIYSDVTARWNADQMRLLRAAAAAAASGERARVRELISAQGDRVRRLDDELRAQTAGALALVERIASRARGATVRSQRARAAAVGGRAVGGARCLRRPDAGQRARRRTGQTLQFIDAGPSCALSRLTVAPSLDLPIQCGDVQAEVTFDGTAPPAPSTRSTAACCRKTRSTACSACSQVIAFRHTRARPRLWSHTTSGSPDRATTRSRLARRRWSRSGRCCWCRASPNRWWRSGPPRSTAPRSRTGAAPGASAIPAPTRSWGRR